MSDRDRLAADLIKAGWTDRHTDADMGADRLFVLGWRNVKSPEFVDGLARALNATVGHGWLRCTPPDPVEEWRMNARAIAKAYREDK